MFEVLRAIGSILLVDLILSGDNALIIGAAASGLLRRQRFIAIAAGGAAAIILRIIFTAIATLLLQLPLLQAIGGVLLLIVAIRLLAERDTKQTKKDHLSQPHTAHSLIPPNKKRKSLMGAIATIMVADLTMSLDNVLAIGAIASGEILYLVIGVTLSIILILIGSALIAELIGKLPWLMDLAALVLAWTAAKMILQDLQLGPILDDHNWTQFLIPFATIAIVIIADILLRIRDTRRAQHVVAR
ncbi:MAG TPA: YjbE family putative metal transport protein [Ktedonobacteraceae bacterium]|nr:YjbE family putative metal transport protein [Ktedonobacteraceae bacterium]